MSEYALPGGTTPFMPPSLEERVRTTAVFDGVTYYLPGNASQYWYIFDGTQGYTWLSAIGTQPGLSASMSNPFSRVYLRVLPSSMYKNQGKVEFYLDGASVGSLDLSSEEPFDGYSDTQVSYYEIASGLPETMHTVTMLIASGTIAFDGWRMEYKNTYYDIDCGDANTLEYDTVSETEKLRDGLESYAEMWGGYPNPASYTNLINYIDLPIRIFDKKPTNPFSGDIMMESEEYSGGDYDYQYASSTYYTLVAYGGRGELVTLSPDHAESDVLTLDLDSPVQNHFATSSASVLFSGTVSDISTELDGPLYLAPSMYICCGLSGMTQFPATDTFSYEVALKEGVNNIKVMLKSPFGPSISITRTITKDTTAPKIILIDPFPLKGPVGAQYIDSNTQTITVKAYVEKGSSAWLNGVLMSVDAQGVFQSSMILATGTTPLDITSSDAFGNTNSVSYTINYGI